MSRETTIGVLRVLEEGGYLTRPVGESLKNKTYDCPFHALGRKQRTPSFGVNLETGQFNCFNPECPGKGPSIYVLYSKLTGTPLWQVKEIIGQPVIPKDALVDITGSLLKKIHGPLGMILQKPWPPCINVKDDPGALSYMESRGIPQDLWEKAGIKFYPGEYLPEEEDIKPTVSGRRIVFPIYYWGNLLVGYSSRSLKRDDFLKYYRPVNNIGNFFYNPFMLDSSMTDHIILLEGEFDVLACLREGLPAWGCFGSSFSNHQAEEASRFKTVYLAFDADSAGVAGMKKAAKKLIGYVGIKFVKFPKKDAGELPVGFGKDFYGWASDKLPEAPGVGNQDFVELL